MHAANPTTEPSQARRRAKALAASVVGLALLAGCGSSGGSDKAAGSSTTAAAAPATSTTTTTTAGATTTAPATTLAPSTTTPAPTTTTPGAEPGDILPPGDTVAILKGIGASTTANGISTTPLTFDEVQFLTGQAAIDAAVAHHDAATDSNGHPYVDNDYYVVNDNPKLRTMLVAGTATVTIDGCDGGCPSQQSASLAQAASNHIGYFRLHVVGHGAAARITKISQIFVP